MLNLSSRGHGFRRHLSPDHLLVNVAVLNTVFASVSLQYDVLQRDSRFWEKTTFLRLCQELVDVDVASR